jgi:hypothetical protein
MNTAVLQNPQAFSFGLLRANSDADAIDAKFQIESEKKGGNIAQIGSDCCSCNHPPQA